MEETAIAAVLQLQGLDAACLNTQILCGSAYRLCPLPQISLDMDAGRMRWAREFGVRESIEVAMVLDALV
jgi:hypothetical protein